MNMNQAVSPGPDRTPSREIIAPLMNPTLASLIR
jgi:hypothetical protein